MTFRLKLNRRPFKLIAFDPGERNFFYCLIENNQVVVSDNFKKTYNKITPENIKPFVLEVRDLISKYKPDLVVSERWIIRTFVAKISETINKMIGALDTICSIKNIKFVYVTAQSWKISIKKLLDLKELYKYAKKNYKLPPHKIDAMLIGRYYLSNNNFKPSDKKWIYANLPKLV